MTHITMNHGAGGSYMQALIKDYIVKYLGGSSAEVPLEALDDSAVICRVDGSRRQSSPPDDRLLANRRATDLAQPDAS